MTPTRKGVRGNGTVVPPCVAWRFWTVRPRTGGVCASKLRWMRWGAVSALPSFSIGSLNSRGCPSRSSVSVARLFNWPSANFNPGRSIQRLWFAPISFNPFRDIEISLEWLFRPESEPRVQFRGVSTPHYFPACQANSNVTPLQRSGWSLMGSEPRVGFVRLYAPTHCHRGAAAYCRRAVR